MNLEKPLVIITGASKGIGYKTAETFLDNRFDVLNVSRNACTLTGVSNIKLDLISATDEAIKNKLSSHVPHTRRIILIHNSSVCYNDTVQNFNAAHWQDTLRLNVTIPALLSQWLLPQMMPQSAIVFIGSTLSEKAVGNTCSYTVSKHAVLGLMRTVCQDLAGKFIHTCCVCPGVTDTEMFRLRVENNPALLAKLTRLQSDDRLLQPQEIAEAIFMAATHPIFNGAVLHANGGQIER
ncbi:MAG: protein fixR [Gammaproteobacteria bacterium]|jgi:NAD(P)-dependent dehydrogenase (short-subunit alcohol dehydrogenase family)|nr:protein fixR [Gammaproteobacteria bacterium]